MRPLLLALGLGGCLAAQAVPLELGPELKPIVQVQAEDDAGKLRTLRLLLDTGARHCLLTPEAARGLVTAPYTREVVGGFAGGGRPALARRLRALRAGDLRQVDLPVLVMELDTLNRWLDRPVDGILGLPFLAGRRFTLDPGRGVLVWEGPPIPGTVVPIVLRPGDPRPHVALRLGGGPGEALVDTGASVALVAPRDTPGLQPLPGCDVAGAVDGVRTVREGRVALEALGGRFSRRRALLGGEAILGLPALLPGPCTFDLREGRLHLGPPGPAAEGARHLPLAWNRRGGPFLEVVELPRCHGWFAAGFRKGDRILTAGPLTGAALTLGALDARLAAGEILVWTVARKGRTVALRNPDEDPRREPLDLPGP
ncbi:MAG TPA: aspartyl protease family protein [Holophagaceae bacterium]|nr:aspartyl protease family protein [Holophagaceae bacterium]